jgi:hypothetical protein
MEATMREKGRMQDLVNLIRVQQQEKQQIREADEWRYKKLLEILPGGMENLCSIMKSCTGINGALLYDIQSALQEEEYFFTDKEVRQALRDCGYRLCLRMIRGTNRKRIYVYTREYGRNYVRRRQKKRLL